MKDVVLLSFVKDYSDADTLSHDPGRSFSRFVATRLLQKYHGIDPPEVDDIITDGERDTGIDVLAIIVNDRIVADEAGVDYLLKGLKRLDVDFVFIQIKSSDSFKSAEIGTFGHGVEQFFHPKNSMPSNDAIGHRRALKDYIFSKSVHMDRNPRCHMYYVTAGTWGQEGEALARIDSTCETLRDFHLFDLVEFQVLGASELKTISREIARGVVREASFERAAVFPMIDGVDEAYIGLMSGAEFLKPVEDEQGRLNRSLFYDNVRDFQGNNPVNQDISETLRTENSRDRFAILNNGVAIVAREIKRTGDTFRISNYQIVNGCQTTHVLFQHKKDIRTDVHVPVKLLATQNTKIITEVVKATNWQTPVLPEALESLAPFHRELEDYYLAQDPSKPPSQRIYYERRSKQYAFDQSIKTSRVITLPAQVLSFVSMFLNEPHSRYRYYGEVLKAYQSRLFIHDHSPSPYYTSGLALVQTEALFRSQQSDGLSKEYKHHVLMMIRVLAAGNKMPRLNSKEMEPYCQRINRPLKDRDAAKELINRAGKIVKSALRTFRSSETAPPNRLRAFTQHLLSTHADRDAVPAQLDPAPGTIHSGVIDHFDSWKNFGFIRSDSEDKYFFHASSVVDIPHRLRHRGTRVKFLVEDSDRGPVAARIELLSA
ncbi:MAG: AIPR family protein [Planctomycetota bacterium]